MRAGGSVWMLGCICLASFCSNSVVITITLKTYLFNCSNSSLPVNPKSSRPVSSFHQVGLSVHDYMVQMYNKLGSDTTEYLV